VIKRETGVLCNNEKNCFCVGEACIIGGDCRRGNAFVRGEPICDAGWDFFDATVFCRTIGFLSARFKTDGSQYVCFEIGKIDNLNTRIF
jgi:hypothetical protein